MRSLVLGLLLLQQSTPQNERASIEGRVVDLENRPIASAEIRLSWDPPAASTDPASFPRARTDADGAFVVQDIKPATYRMTASAPGYVLQHYGADVPGSRGLSRRKIITLAAGEIVRNIVVRLTGEGVISGSVTQNAGQPILGAEVFALRRSYDAEGSLVFSHEVNRVRTNDRGAYRIVGLAPGSYYVAASSPPEAMDSIEARIAAFEGRSAPPSSTPGKYSTAFHPATASSATAIPVAVGTSAESRNIDIQLTRQPTFAIRGRIFDSSGDPLKETTVDVIISSAELDFVSVVGGYPVTGPQDLPYKGNGIFEFKDMAPGTYWVVAQLRRQRTAQQRQLVETPGLDPSLLPPWPTSAFGVVRVTNADVDNVELHIVPDPIIRGTIRLEGQSWGSELAGVKVDLRPVSYDKSLLPTMGVFSMEGSGRFTYKNIRPFKFRVQVSKLPADLYVKEIRFGNDDALAQPIIPTGEARTLDTLLAKGGRLRGTTIESTPNAQVILIPEERGRSDLYRAVTTESRGQFDFRGIAPGNYSIFAWRDIEPFEYFDPAFLRRFNGEGIPVRVEEGSDATVRLNITP